MKDSIVKFFWFTLGIFILFAILDLFNITGWFLFPIGCFRKDTVCTQFNGKSPGQ
jgi:hypothetical protein